MTDNNGPVSRRGDQGPMLARADAMAALHEQARAYTVRVTWDGDPKP